MRIASGSQISIRNPRRQYASSPHTTRNSALGNFGTRPPNSIRFESGASAPEPTERELNALAAKARTPAEHRALEEYFLTLAKRYTAEANEDATVAQAYRGTRLAQAAVHHDRLVRLSRDSATEAMAAAAGCTNNSRQ